MDPFTHTMVGATLAQAGLARKTRYGAAALVIGANLPDIDAFTQLLGMDTALYLRRGWTHGVLALVVLPLLLTAVLACVARRSRSSAPPPDLRFLFLFSTLAFAIHLPMDWVNTYGIRWLMPFDDQWFYGDAVFITDPWLWLALGGTVFLRSSRTRKGKTAWGVVAALAALLVFLGGPPNLLPLQFLWLSGIVLLVALRFRDVLANDARAGRFARGALAFSAVYLIAMSGLARIAKVYVQDQLARQGVEVERLLVGPVPITPFAREVLIETPDDYRHGRLELAPGPRLELEARSFPRPPATPLIRSALSSPQIEGFMSWVRFPYVEVEEDEQSYTVYVMDARYTLGRTRGFGGATVVVPKVDSGVGEGDPGQSAAEQSRPPSRSPE